MNAATNTSAKSAVGFSTHIAWTFAVRMVMLASGVLTGVIVARSLGAKGAGQLAVLSVAAVVAVQLGSAGLPSANTYLIAQDRTRLRSAWSNSLVFALLAGCLLMLALVGAAQLFPAWFKEVPTPLIMAAAVALPFQLVTLLGTNALLGLHEIKRFNLLDASAQFALLLSAVLTLVVLRSGDLFWLVCMNTAASALVSIAVWRNLDRIIEREQTTDHVGLATEQTIGLSSGLASERDSNRRINPLTRFRFDGSLFRQTLAYGVKFHIAIVAGTLLFRADVLLVNHYRGAGEAGVYAVAAQAAMLLMMLPGIIGTLLMPRVAAHRDSSDVRQFATSHFDAQRFDAQSELTRRTVRHAAFVMLLICALAIPASLLFPFVYGREFAGASALFLILLPGIYLIGIESILVQHFSGTGLPAAIPCFWLVTLAINVSLNLWFVPQHGARAAAIASSACYALMFALVALYFRARTGKSFAGTFLINSDELRGLLRLPRRALVGSRLKK